MTKELQHILKKYHFESLPGVFDGKRNRMLEIPGRRGEVFPELFTELGYTRGVEVGVEQAVFAKTLCQGIKTLNVLYGVDPWKAYSGYREHVSQEKLDGFYDDVLKKMKNEPFIPIRKFSHEAAEDFADGSLDFVYIDGNHEFFEVTRDLHVWIPKIRKGGIVAGHDFRRNSGKYVNDVKDVIPAYMYAKQIPIWFVVREKQSASSWFFVKE